MCLWGPRKNHVFNSKKKAGYIPLLKTKFVVLSLSIIPQGWRWVRDENYLRSSPPYYSTMLHYQDSDTTIVEQ